MNLLRIVTPLLLLWACENNPHPSVQKSPFDGLERDTLYFINKKWNDTIFIESFIDSTFNKKHYVLGKDTMSFTEQPLDTFIDCNNIPQPIYNPSIKQFLTLFTDTTRIYSLRAGPIKRKEIELISHDSLINNDNKSWVVLNTNGMHSIAFHYLMNIDTDIIPESIIELINPADWVHEYLFFNQNENQKYIFIGSIRADNKKLVPDSIRVLCDKKLIGIPFYSEQADHQTQLYHLYQFNNNHLMPCLESVLAKRNAVLHNFSSGYSANTKLRTEFELLENGNELAVSYYYSLLIRDSDSTYELLKDHIYRRIYVYNRKNEKYESKLSPDEIPDWNEEDLELTALYLNQIDAIRQHGTVQERKLLSGFSKSSWIQNDDSIRIKDSLLLEAVLVMRNRITNN